MTRYIAFLRAINVGGHTVKMDQLRGLFEALGLANVETFIASGNVIFETKEKSPSSLETKIAAHLETSLGFEVDTFLRTIEEVAAIARRSPFKAETKNDNIYVAFLHEILSASGKTTLMDARNKGNEFATLHREIYWLRLNKDESIFLKSSLEKILKLSTTVRNMTTIHKILEKVHEGA